jgi:hypothetical protein
LSTTLTTRKVHQRAQYQCEYYQKHKRHDVVAQFLYLVSGTTATHIITGATVVKVITGTCPLTHVTTEDATKELFGPDTDAQWDNVSEEMSIVPIVIAIFIRLMRSTPGVTVAFTRIGSFGLVVTLRKFNKILFKVFFILVLVTKYLSNFSLVDSLNQSLLRRHVCAFFLLNVIRKSIFW